MDDLKSLSLDRLKKIKRNTHLHSDNHLVADELSQKLKDKKHFAFYLKMAVLYNHDWLRSLAARVLEQKNVTTPGRLFAYLVKEERKKIKELNKEAN